jgi:hypothetical protein
MNTSLPARRRPRSVIRVALAVALAASLLASTGLTTRAITLGSSNGAWLPVVCNNFNPPAFPPFFRMEDCNVSFEASGPNGDTTIRWGVTAAGTPKSGLGFKGVANLAITPGSDFTAGTLYHYNFPVNDGSALSRVRLAIGLTFSDPAGLATSRTFTFEIDETADVAPCDYPSASPCADALFFPDMFSQETFTDDGRKYVLEIVGFQVGGATVSQMISQEGQVSSASLVARVVDVTPSVTIESPADGAVVLTNSVVDLTAAIVDPLADGDNSHSCAIDWGDGGQDVAGTVSDDGGDEVCSASYPGYATAGTYTITVAIDDGEGGVASESVTIVVNSAPAAEDDTYETDEGTPLIVAAPGVLENDADDDGDPLTAVLEDGPAGGSLTLNADGSFSYTPDAGFFGVDTFTYRASDGLMASNVATVTVTVVPLNEAPELATIGDQSVDEGSLLTFTAMATDVDGDGLTFSLKGAPAGATIDPVTGVFSWTPADNGVFTFTVIVTDDGTPSRSDEETITVTVRNVAPGIGGLTRPEEPVAVTTPVIVTAAVSDPGTADTQTAAVDWGDGSAPTVVDVPGSGGVSAIHVYTAPGVYTVTLRVEDDDGGVETTTFEQVVFDPDAGFVTGAGWIESPQGAVVDDPDAVGRAHFAFTARYRGEQTVPDGHVQFRAGDLSFRGTAYEWLLIDGERAQLRGIGTIGGAGEYGFVLTAIDGRGEDDADRLRIRIWEVASGAIVYDSQPGDGEDAEPVATLGGGNIVVHD